MARNLWRNTLLAVVLSFLSGFAGVWIGLKVLPGQRPATVNLHVQIHRDLSLNAGQKATLHQLEAQYARSRVRYREKLKAANARLAEAIRKHHDLSPEVQLAEQNYLKVLGDFQTETLRHIFAMRAILSPAQAQEFDALMLRSLHDIAR